MAVLEGNEPRLGAVLQNVALLAAYLTLNCTLNLLNKWSLGIYGMHLHLSRLNNLRCSPCGVEADLFVGFPVSQSYNVNHKVDMVIHSITW